MRLYEDMKEYDKSGVKVFKMMFPSDWEYVFLDNIISSSDYGTSELTNEISGYPVLRMGNIIDGKIDTKDLVYLELDRDIFEHLKLEKGDILFNRTNSYALVGKFALFNLDDEYIFASYLVRLKVKTDVIMPEYVNYYMNMDSSKQIIKKIVTKGVLQCNINPSVLKKYFKITFPSDVNEQKSITSIILAWDKAIELKEKLIEQKKEQKRGLMKELLTCQKRLPGFETKWKVVSLKDILKQRKEKSGVTNDLVLYSLTIEDGVTPKTDRYNREFLVKSDNKKYKITRKNDIVYNPANLRFGAIALNKNDQPVLLSPIYEILFIKNIKKFDINFIGHLLTWDRNIRYFATKAEGTLVERMAVKVDVFLNVSFVIPVDVEEQHEISSMLDNAHSEIALLKQEISSLKLQKKGLMQLLLTGKVRVKY